MGLVKIHVGRSPKQRSMETLLKVEGLTKRFPQVIANDNISFEIQKGEIHCLLGENGAGKSTLAECLYGFYKPDAGTIFFKGKPVKLSTPSDAIQLGIGMVHQHFVLVQPLTVVENVIVGTANTSLLLDLPKAEARLLSLCDKYGVELDLEAKIWQLSVGEQQWVEILKALYVGLELLILDEPTAVLTPQETNRLFSVLNQMTKEGLSILLITHKLNEVMQVSDQVTVLRKGQKVDTVATADVAKVDLARMMVGREVVFRVKKERKEIGQKLLEITDLRAKGDRGQEALRGVTLDLHRGEILGLAGVSGNGQRELFEVLAGVRKADTGQILLAGEDVTNISAQEIMNRGLGYIPEDRLLEGLIPDFTIAENLILGQQRTNTYKRGPFFDFEMINKNASEAVSEFEIATPSVDQTTRFLSGGNLQKVILARELRQAPRCLLAHQPTRGLDVGVIEYVHRQLLEQRANGAAILMASEDLDEIFNLADRIAVIYKGQIMGIQDASKASREHIGLWMAGVSGEEE